MRVHSTAIPHQRPGAEIFAVEVEKIEQEEDEGGGIAAVGRQLDHAEGGDAVGADAAQLAVEIGLAGTERVHRRGDRRIFVRPVEPGARQQFHRAAVEARMHAVAVVLDFVEPLIAVRRRVDEFRQLRPDPLRQRGHCRTIGSISEGSLFLTLPTRWPTGQQVIASDG